MAVRCAEVQGVLRPSTRSTPATSASAASGRSRSPTRREATSTSTALRRRIQAGPQHDLALRRLPAARAARRAARCRPAGRRCARRPARRAPRPAARCGSRTTPPTRRTRSRTASSRWRWRGRRSSASTWSPAPPPATSPTRSPPTPRPPGCESYVFIPADLEEQKILATGVYGTNLVAVRGNYDDVNRLCTELSGEHDWAFVNVNLRPYYAEGSKTLAFETAEQLGWELPDRVVGADRLRLAVHEDRPRLRGVDRRSGLLDGDAADVQRRPGRRLLAGGQAFADGHDVCRPVQARTRSPSRWPSATRPTAPTRSSSRGAPAAASTPSTDDEIRAGIRLLAETTGIFTETAGGVTTAMLAKLAERGDIGADERVVVVITGDGLKTLDVARGTFETHEIEPSLDAFEASGADRRERIGFRAAWQSRSSSPRSCGRSPAARPRPRSTAATVGEVLDALFDRFGDLRERICDDGDLRRFVNVYVGGRGHPLPRRPGDRGRRRRRGDDPARRRRWALAPRPGAPVVTVAVATHDRPDRLAALLEALRAQKLSEAFEVVVVDDGSGAGDGGGPGCGTRPRRSRSPRAAPRARARALGGAQRRVAGGPCTAGGVHRR